MRPTLHTLTALALLVALVSVVAAVAMPAGSTVSTDAGGFVLECDRYAFFFGAGDVNFAHFPHHVICLVLGVPSAIYLGKAVLSLIGRRKDHRGFEVTCPPHD